jgi:hypothetical protein
MLPMLQEHLDEREKGEERPKVVKRKGIEKRVIEELLLFDPKISSKTFI